LGSTSLSVSAQAMRVSRLRWGESDTMHQVPKKGVWIRNRDWGKKGEITQLQYEKYKIERKGVRQIFCLLEAWGRSEREILLFQGRTDGRGMLKNGSTNSLSFSGQLLKRKKNRGKRREIWATAYF